MKEWVANNQNKTYPSPPSIQSFLGAMSNGAWADDMAVEWRDYAPAPPTLIDIGPDRTRKRATSARPIGPEPVLALALLRVNEEVLQVELPDPDDLDNLSVAVNAHAAAPGCGGIAAARVPVAAAAAAAMGPVAATAAMTPRPPRVPPVRRRPVAAPAPKAMGMSLGCTTCRWATHGCSQCQCVEWRRLRTEREAQAAG